MHSATVRVALLTPPGRGALAVVGVAGNAAVAAVAKLFFPRGGVPLAERSDGAIVFGRWADADRGEELVVVRHSAGRLEVHSHGGMAASEAVLESLEALGAVRESWQDWLATTGASPLELEAREALARAGGPKAAQILARQLAGPLDGEIDRITRLDTAGDHVGASAARDRLWRAARVGLRLTRPWRVVVAGLVNAGKSSLVNALAGYARSIVSAEPGTTRDLLETRIVLEGWEIDLIDTAGLRDQPADEVEREGMARAASAVAGADLILRVLDGEQASACLPTGIPELVVLSKCDLAASGSIAPPHAIRTSVVTGLGIEELAAAILHRLVPEERNDPGLLAGAVPFTERQVGMFSGSVRPGGPGSHQRPEVGQENSAGCRDFP